MVNLHPGLASSERHHFYLVKLVAKYAVNPYKRCYTAVFNGPVGTQTRMNEYQIPHISLPKHLQKKKYVTFGK